MINNYSLSKSRYNKNCYKLENYVKKQKRFPTSFPLPITPYSCMPPLLLPSSPSSSLPNSEPNSKEQDTDLSLLYTLSYKNPLLTISTTLILYLGSKKIWFNFGRRIKNDDYLIGNSWLGKDGRRKLKGVCTRLVCFVWRRRKGRKLIDLCFEVLEMEIILDYFIYLYLGNLWKFLKLELVSFFPSPFSLQIMIKKLCCFFIVVFFKMIISIYQFLINSFLPF